MEVCVNIIIVIVHIVIENKEPMSDKSLGSNKMNKACLAMLKVNIFENYSSVCTEFWKTHCGHVEEIGRTRLNKDVRTQIAGMNYRNNRY